MARDTKESFLAAALDMFSRKGYAGTNIRELAASLGLVKSGLYIHFESKEAIWNSMLAFVYTVPISALIHLCGREPEKAEDAMTQAEAFSRYSITIHGVQ